MEPRSCLNKLLLDPALSSPALGWWAWAAQGIGSPWALEDVGGHLAITAHQKEGALIKVQAMWLQLHHLELLLQLLLQLL